MTDTSTMVKTAGRRGGFARALLSVCTAATLSTVGLLVASSGTATAVGPPTFTVNTTTDGADSNVGDGVCADTSLEGNECTLRAAIQEADATSGGAIVVVPAGTYTLTLNPSSDDINESDGASGDLNVTSLADGSGNVTIQGAGQDTTTITTSWGKGAVDRVLAVSSGATASVTGVTITGGDLTGELGCGSESGDLAEGAGILNEGTLVLTNSTVTENTNQTDSASGISAGDGGGIAALGDATTTLTGDTVTSNTTFGNGGGVAQTSCGSVGGTPTLTIGGSIIGSNNADGTGGGVDLEVGNATISSTNLNQNSSISDSGAVQQDSTGSLSIDTSTLTSNRATGGDGGAIDSDNSGPITVTNSTVTGNHASGDGGGFGEDGGDAVTISGTTISDNSANGDGGGIGTDGGGSFNVTSSIISSNSSFFGGGGMSDDGGDVINLTNTTVTSNQSNQFGGGLIGFGGGTYTIVNSTVSSNIAKAGGGIDTDADTWVITGTTINNNTAQATFVIPDVRPAVRTHDQAHALVQPHSTGEDGEGAGVYNDDCDVVSLTNDTITGNGSTADGGGYITDFCLSKELVRHAARGSHAAALSGQTFLNDTINGNTSGSGAADFEQNDVSNITMTHTIVADGTPLSCSSSNAATWTSGGYNLFSGPQCGTAGTGDLANTEPLLGALGNNGGPTATELPGSTSPAIGAVPSSSCPPPATDQRGIARPGGANGTCTIGAVEVVIPVPQPINFNGYRMAANDGGVFDFGIQFHGSLADGRLNAPIIGLANSPGPNGYLLAGADGGVFALGGAEFFGSLGGHVLPSPIAAIAGTPDGGGYWLASQKGTTYNFGDAPALPAVQVPGGDHIVGIASTNDGKGLWLTDNAGDVYTLGDAQFLGSLGGKHLNAPIVAIAPAASGQGYILAAADGGVFAFGVGFFGSVPSVLKSGQTLNAPVVGIAETHSGNGYWEVGADGGVFCFGDAPFYGSTYTQLKPGQPLNGPIVGIQHLGSLAG